MCPRPESNQRHADFQSAALPTELPEDILIFNNEKHSLLFLWCIFKFLNFLDFLQY